MCIIKALQPRERVLFDAETIACIYRNVGPLVAERMINRAFATLGDVLLQAKAAVGDNNIAMLDQKLAEICLMSDNLGLTTLSFVSQNAQDSLKAGSCAFEALWARLLRVADQSLDLKISNCDQLS